MRKILSALLAVMMLVGILAALPVSADTTVEPVKTIDGTTAADYNSTDLVVTEVMVNSKSNVDKYNDIVDTLSTSKTSSYDCFDYIEIYNKGNEAVNLYDYCLLRRANQGMVHAYETEGTFDRQNYIAPGTIYQSSYGVNPALEKWGVVNPSEVTYDASKPASEQLHWLQPGQFAVIWFWTSQCDTVSTNNGSSMAAPDDDYGATENAHYFPQFRDFYNVPDDTIVLAVYAQNNATNAAKAFDLVAGNAYMYALATNDYDIAEPAIENVGSNSAELNPKIESLFCWGVGTKAGIPTTDGTDHQATNYMPPIASPDLYNQEYINLYSKDNPNFDEAAVRATNFDYVQTGHSLSYKEMAIFKYAEEPTVGSMPLYQWAYVHPEGLWNNWNAMYQRAEEEIDAVVRAKVYEIVKQAITDEVNADGNITASNKPTVIEERLAEANLPGNKIDQDTDARLRNAAQYAVDLQEHYESLLKTIICDYDTAINYKVYETDINGDVVMDEDGNPVETEEFLLLDANGDLLHTVQNSEYVWVSRLTDRFVELTAYKLVDAEVKDEEQINPDLVDRDELEKIHDEANADRLFNRGADTVNGKTYTKYQQGSTMYYYDAGEGKFYTLKETVVPAEVQQVSQLATWGLILIIVGALIVVAGIAAVVIIIVKSKNKPVAADDVAAEGEVQVIDETANAPTDESNNQ